MTRDQGWPDVDQEIHDRYHPEELLPLLWEQFLMEGPQVFVDQRIDLLSTPDYLMALASHYATEVTEKKGLTGVKQAAIVTAFEGHVYDIVVERLAQLSK